MAVCQWCKQEMNMSVSCTGNIVELKDGRKLDAVPFEPEDSDVKKCPDCATPVGGAHHPGCDNEECPECGFQIIGCDCLCDDEEEE